MIIDTFFRSRLIAPSNHVNDFASWSLTPAQYFWGQRDLQIIDNVVYEIKPLHYRYQEESMLQTALMVALFIPSLIVGTLARDLSFLASSEIRDSFAAPLQKRVDSIEVDKQDTIPSHDSHRSEDEEDGHLIKRELPPLSQLPKPDLQQAVVYNTLISPASPAPSSTPLSARERFSMNTPRSTKTPQEMFLTSPVNKYLYREQTMEEKQKRVVKLRAQLEMLKIHDEGAASGLVKVLDMEAYYTRLMEMIEDDRYIQSLEKSESKELGLELRRTYLKASLFFTTLTRLFDDREIVENWLDEEMTKEDYGNYFFESFMLFHPFKLEYRPEQIDDFYDLWKELYTAACEKLTKLDLQEYLYEGLDEFFKIGRQDHSSSPLY